MKNFVKSNCVICGPKCAASNKKLRKFNDSIPDMYVGKECYKNLNGNFNWGKSKYESKSL